jgi:hypothetical protein
MVGHDIALKGVSLKERRALAESNGQAGNANEVEGGEVGPPVEWVWVGLFRGISGEGH